MFFPYRYRLLWFIVFIGAVLAYLAPPIPQNPDYHRFADQRTFAGIPHFLNVASNLPFFGVGLWGIREIVMTQPSAIKTELRNIYLAFFAGILFTGIGSSYYHWQPDNQTLVWDRLPMTIAFAALFAAAIGDFISVHAAKSLFPVLLCAGSASVFYWHITELGGHGDLRPYAVVQFLPMLLLPLILVLFPSGNTKKRFYWAILAIYGLAKIMEYFDAGLYKLLNGISGHSIKHLLAAYAGFLFLKCIRIENSTQ